MLPGGALRVSSSALRTSGYDVLSSEGRSIGRLEHVRYRLHTDHPDEIVIRRLPLFWKRRRILPFNTVEAVDARAGTVTLRPGWDSVERTLSA